MTTVNLASPEGRLVRRNPTRAVPFVLAARKPHRSLPLISLRVPVTPANRKYLRELRDAELQAWQSGGQRRRPASVGERAVESPSEQRDLYVFGLIVAMAMVLAWILLGHSSSVTQQFAHWVDRVRQFLG